MRWLLATLLLITINSSCGDNEIVEPSFVFVLVGAVSDSSSANPLSGVSILRRFPVGNGDPGFHYLEQATTDTVGDYMAILGYSVTDSQWMFEKTGYTSKHFTLFADAVRIDKETFRLDAVLAPQ